MTTRILSEHDARINARFAAGMDDTPAADIFADPDWGDHDVLDDDDETYARGLRDADIAARHTLRIDRKHVYRWFDPRRWRRARLYVQVTK